MTAMFRTTAARSLSRSLQSLHTTTPRYTLTGNVVKATLRTSARPAKLPGQLSLVLRTPQQTSLVRYQSTFVRGLDKKLEETLQQQKLEPEPELVTSSSSMHPVQGEIGSEEAQAEDVDMMAGIRSDFETIKETFTLRDVPREALYVGMAGVVPYLATSLTTFYLSFDIQYAAHHGQGFLISGELAENLLHVIEPIQLGYGASIISFLGAIHWGLEWAGFGGHQGYPRYSIGIIATAVAWPTLLLPVEIGLATQFLAFTFLYYADARASTRGWAPAWYSTYRFVLTFVVGTSIVVSLIGRGQIADLVTRPPGPADRMKALRASQADTLPDEEADEAEGEGEDAEGEDEE